MKLSELRPCDNCLGKVIPQFYILRVSMALFDPKAYQEVMGMAQMMGGLDNPGALAVSETLAPTDDVIIIGMDKDEDLMTEIILCHTCYCGKKYNIAELVEKAQQYSERVKNIGNGLAPKGLQAP